MILQQENEFAKSTQRKNNRFFKSMYFLDKNELLKHYDKIFVFDKTSVQTAFLKRYHVEKLIKYLKTNKTIELLVRK